MHTSRNNRHTAQRSRIHANATLCESDRWGDERWNGFLLMLMVPLSSFLSLFSLLFSCFESASNAYEKADACRERLDLDRRHIRGKYEHEPATPTPTLTSARSGTTQKKKHTGINTPTRGHQAKRTHQTNSASPTPTRHSCILPTHIHLSTALVCLGLQSLTSLR